jgi:hypothetical protein
LRILKDQACLALACSRLTYGKLRSKVCAKIPRAETKARSGGTLGQAPLEMVYYRELTVD